MTYNRQSNAAAQTDNDMSSLASFSRLTYALQARIVTMACWLPDTDEADEEMCNSPLTIDKQTTLSLALVCKSFNTVATKALFERLSITRPSTLRRLVPVLVNRPELGRLIRSLHLGPDGVPQHDWLPVYEDAVIISMSVPTDHDHYPSWLQTPYEFYFDDDRSDGPAYLRALQDAILSARRSLRIDLTQVGYSHSEEPMDENVWYDRVFVAHAAIELYVLEMARCDNRNRQSSGGQASTRYPRLVIEGSRSSASSRSRFPKKPAFVVTQQDVFDRLTASKAATDRFDHPLLFIRSRLAWEAEGHDEQPYRGGNTQRQWVEGSSLDPFSSAADSLEPPPSSAATLKGCLILARTLLSHTPLLQTLSLSGFLERAICGADAPTELEALQSLSLGPPPDRWGWLAALRPAESILARLQRMRITGYLIGKGQVAGVVGNTMPRLQSFQWSYAKPITDGSAEKSERLLDVLSILVGCDLVPDQGVTASKRPRLDQDDSNDLLSINVSLNDRDVACALQAAPDLATRAAWLEGSTPPVGSGCRRRFRITSCSGDAGTLSVYQHRRRQMEDMYHEGRLWMEEARIGRALEARDGRRMFETVRSKAISRTPWTVPPGLP